MKPTLQRKKRLFLKDIPQSTKDEIIEYYRSNKNNSISSIAKHFNLTYEFVSPIINEYLKPKN